MSAFGKVTYSETDDNAIETTVESVESATAVDKQVEKFDTSFNAEKLQELYAEYDKITIDEEKVKSLTQVKVDAIPSAVSFRMVLGVTTTAIVAVLMLFLCIYNIFVINNMGTSINYLQEEVISCENSLVQSEGVYNALTDKSNIQKELAQMGYSEMTSSNIVAVSVPDSTEVIELQGETNWFDAVCNFLSQIFG
ncbi:MAG: hypothetical protein E7356_02950 [Clostridiales bacterium]|nr:hypothetical protein [Clostridiales bacterium]